MGPPSTEGHARAVTGQPVVHHYRRPYRRQGLGCKMEMVCGLQTFKEAEVFFTPYSSLPWSVRTSVPTCLVPGYDMRHLQRTPKELPKGPLASSHKGEPEGTDPE